MPQKPKRKPVQKKKPSPIITFVKQYKRPIRILAAVGVFFVAVIAFVVDPFAPGEMVHGRLLDRYSPNSQIASDNQYLVELDSGETVSIESYAIGTFEKGRAVILQEHISRIFKRKTYKFIKYDDPNLQ